MEWWNGGFKPYFRSRSGSGLRGNLSCRSLLDEAGSVLIHHSTLEGESARQGRQTAVAPVGAGVSPSSVVFLLPLSISESLFNSTSPPFLIRNS